MGHTPSSSANAENAVQISAAAYLGEDVGSLSSVMFKNTRTVAPSVGRTGRCGLLSRREGESARSQKGRALPASVGPEALQDLPASWFRNGIRSAGALPSAGSGGSWWPRSGVGRVWFQSPVPRYLGPAGFAPVRMAFSSQCA